MGSQKSKSQWTQHGRLLQAILKDGLQSCDRDFVMRTAGCTSGSIRQVLLNLNTAIKALFFSAAEFKEIPPPVQYNREAQLYKVYFTIRQKAPADDEADDAAVIHDMMDRYADSGRE